eukprot:CAMPEP_0171634954 /NCGR_PEP_ID=MMETSP0990-20121206/26315_1 /TAXON_ID=483369 /ORGANISM="non described non described, Strain CCMP2098" /LENGTH=192 /DNA_ID=CAMNT_0012206379 /DNA_START=145 /DNA_END=723 /DNA_ORIENTATION=+
MFSFRPNDTHGMHQIPPAKFKMPGVERIQGYRYPAPGSQPLADIPTSENDDIKYDIKYFSRNTRREGHLDADGNSNRYEDMWADGDSKGLALVDDPDAPRGSPGNHYTEATVKAYDPTGLRSAMTATHAEMYKSIQAHLPTHNVRMAWEGNEVFGAVADKLEAKGLPPIPGYNVNDVTVPPGVAIRVEHSTW